MNTDRCLVLFTKPALAGRVKTRLIGRLTAAQAAALHGAFLNDALCRFSRGHFARQVAWALEEGEALPAALPVAPEAWISVRQHGADLGARMHRALTEAAADHRSVAAVGSDHPELDAARVEAAFECLEQGADLVLGPAADGGYYLIAGRRETLDLSLFEEIAWSTASVLQATMERAEKLRLRIASLPIGHDVDDAEGLARLVERVRGGKVATEIPHTRALLTAWGLLPDRVPFDAQSES